MKNQKRGLSVKAFICLCSLTVVLGICSVTAIYQASFYEKEKAGAEKVMSEYEKHLEQYKVLDAELSENTWNE